MREPAFASSHKNTKSCTKIVIVKPKKSVRSVMWICQWHIDTWLSVVLDYHQYYRNSPLTALVSSSDSLSGLIIHRRLETMHLQQKYTTIHHTYFWLDIKLMLTSAYTEVTTTITTIYTQYDLADFTVSLSRLKMHQKAHGYLDLKTNSMLTCKALRSCKGFSCCLKK